MPPNICPKLLPIYLPCLTLTLYLPPNPCESICPTVVIVSLPLPVILYLPTCSNPVLLYLPRPATVPGALPGALPVPVSGGQPPWRSAKPGTLCFAILTRETISWPHLKT